LRVWAAPIRIFQYNNLSGANSHAVCVLKLSFVKTGDSLLEKKLLTFHYISNVFLVAIAFNGILRCVQAAKQRAVRLSLDCVNGKYLWALPTPTTFEKVDQTFIIDWLNCELNNNLSK